MFNHIFVSFHSQSVWSNTVWRKQCVMCVWYGFGISVKWSKNNNHRNNQLHGLPLSLFLCATLFHVIEICCTKVHIFLRGKCRIHCVDIFLSLFYYCVHSWLLLAICGRCSWCCQCCARRALVALFHNKQTSESMESTATTKMSDKRIMSRNTYFSLRVCSSVFFSILFSRFLSDFFCLWVRWPEYGISYHLVFSLWQRQTQCEHLLLLPPPQTISGTKPFK